MPQFTEQCRNCRFFKYQDALGESQEGECRAHPPKLGLFTEGWPRVRLNDFCGEWAKLPETHKHKEYRLLSSDGLEECICGASNNGWGWTIR